LEKRASTKILDGLLGDRAAALHDAPLAQVGPGGAQDPPQIEPEMRIEASVLGGEHRLPKGLRYLVQPN
jgi:hypothetical protein